MTQVLSTIDPTNTSEFEWFLPIPRRPILAITITNEKFINLNQKLCSQVAKYITIGISSDGKKIGLKEVAGGYFVPKNGVIKDPRLVLQIKSRGVQLPANYLVEKADGCWIAILVPPEFSPTFPKKTPIRPRKTGLKDMLPTKVNKL
jgi:hypothetical protein